MNTAPDDTLPDRAEIPVTPPVLFSVFLIAALVVAWLIPLHLVGGALAPGLGVILLAAAGGVIYYAFQTMKAAGTGVHPREGAAALVTAGPFRYSRNPLYLSLVTIQLAVGLLLDSLAAVLLAFAFAYALRRLVIEPEERYLEQKFGDEYRAFKERVRRWL